MEKYNLHVILSAAVSLDGKIATHTGDSNLSSREDFIRLHKLRSKVDAILIGKNTVKQDDPLLTVRLSKGKNPIRIVLDSNGEISSNSKILQTSNKIPTIIAVSKNINQHNLKKIKKFPVEVVFTGKVKVNIKSLILKLQQKGIKTILVEGGGKINWEFIKNSLFDEIIITISPYLIGGTNAVSFIEGKGFAKIKKSPKLQLKTVKRLQNHLVLHYVRV